MTLTSWLCEWEKEMLLAASGNAGEGLGGGSKMADLNTEHAVLASYAQGDSGQ